MDEAMTKRLEQIQFTWTHSGPGGNHVDFLCYLYRAAYADGQRDERERAAKVIEMDCYGDVGAVIEGDAVKTAHNKEMVRLAGLVRQAAGEVE